MDPASIVIIVGLVTIMVERVFSWSLKVKKSKCMGAEVEMMDDREKKDEIQDRK